MELFLLFPDIWSKNFFYKMFLNFINELKAGFKTGNGIIQTGCGIIFPFSWHPIKKLLLKNVFNFYQLVQNWFWKREMELSKQEMELFLLFPDLQSKNFFYKMFLNFINEFKAGFKNRKWNHPNRKWNYFSYFLTSDQKTSLTKYF